MKILSYIYVYNFWKFFVNLGFNDWKVKKEEKIIILIIIKRGIIFVLIKKKIIIGWIFWKGF